MESLTSKLASKLKLKKSQDKEVKEKVSKENKEKMLLKIYGGLTLVMFLTFAFYTYTNYQNYSSLKNDILEKNRELVSVLNSDVISEKTDFDSKTEDFQELRKEIEESLKKIFPEKDEFASLTRQLEQYEKSFVNFRMADELPFAISSIQFEEPVPNAEDEEGNSLNYSILPFSMSIASTRDNFEDFLHFIETSGTLNTESGDIIRLMDIESISLSFEEVEGAGSEVMEEFAVFNVNVNAYYQPQKDSE